MRRRLMMQSVQVVIKEFTYNGATYSFEDGMTWGQWLASTYNTDGWYYGEVAGYGNSANQSDGDRIITRVVTDSYDVTFYYISVGSVYENIREGSYQMITKIYNHTTKPSDCLTRGDRILLADGTYKNVENITYDDLLMTYDFTTGKITYNYAGLIIHHEKRKRQVLRLCFENNVILSITSRHHLYDYVKNMFSTIDLDKAELEIDISLNNFIGAYYDNGKIVPLKLKTFELLEMDDVCYDIQVSGQEVVFAEGLLSGNDVMNLFPREDFMLYNQDLCVAFKNAIANKDFETNEYEWFKNTISSVYPYYAWRCDYMWAFHPATENSGATEEQKKEIYDAMRKYVEHIQDIILPMPNNLVVNINNETIINAKYGDKIKLPNTHKKYYDNSTFLYYDAGDEVDVIASTYIQALW